MFRNISAWSIRNPVPTLMLFIVLTVAGLVGFSQMRVNNFPDVDFPVVRITAAQPGASPSEIETQITRVIEDSVVGINGARQVISIVGDGVNITVIEFGIGTDLDRVTNDVRNQMSRIKGDLPGDVEEPVVTRVDSSGDPLITYVVRAPGLNPEQKSWFVDNDVAKALLAVKGVASVSRDGGVDREIRIDLDPDRLAAQGVTAAAISQQLRAYNIDLPGGRATIGGEERAIRTLGGARSIQELRDMRIALGTGGSVRLGDLGVVEDSWSEPRGLARLDNEEVVGFSMLRTREGSEVEVARKVRAAVTALDQAHPELVIEEVASSVDYVLDSYIASMETLLIGALLAVIVVWVFLRDWRATLITAVAMPMALIPTFAIMAPMNQSFNVVTLLALSLTIGILVDDAIVEIENIVRHIRDGKAPYTAAMEAADEIGLAVVATTFTIVAVFAPVGFMNSIPGQFFKSFALAACVSVLFSLLVARMLTPLMSAYMLKADQKTEHPDPFWMEPYLVALRWCLAHRWPAFGLATLAFIFSMFLATRLPGEFIPAGDQGFTNITVELPPGARLADTDEVTLEVTRRFMERDEVRNVYASIGSGTNPSGPGGGGSLADVRRANLIVNLVPKGERMAQSQFEREMTAELSNIAGARISLAGQGGGSSSNISVSLVSDDGALLAATARKVEMEMRTLDGFENVINTASIARPEILVTPKPDMAARMGVSPQSISQAVRVATLGDIDQLLPKFTLGDRQIPIRLRLREDARADLDILRNLKVLTSSGATVPLSAVADIRMGAGPSQIDRRDRSRSATITAELNGPALGAANASIHELPSMQGLPAGVRERAAGDVEALGELVSGFVFAIVTGILLMYVVLVLLFKSFLHPITIQAALPLAIGGAFGALLLAGKNLSMPALIGILMLMGVTAKNSILLVEYVLEAMKKRAMDRYDALMDAAHKRARPILMTTVAMGAGMLPIALGFGADIEFRSPMAIAVIGGLITSTILSLLFVPVVFVIIDDLRNVLHRFVGRRFRAQKTLPG